ncbi:serine hydrolase [Staphylococcus sp. HMSC061G12]|uniref:serine hydrolase n=1 Tax=Staphylococcus sp. HMSC061G12 TaxID=1739441 RepID=UPI0008A8699C|nr:serine hydrolase [Staphylococcus sp. HMSC061G12]OHR52277.1 hypothetical protein HMPREF2937_12770 [Staphylococcus sp. HMSC061G12]
MEKPKTIQMFVEKMNEKAASIGMSRSMFKNPTGLTEKYQLSTSYDLSLLTLHASANVDIVRIWKKKHYSFWVKGPNARRMDLTTRVDNEKLNQYYDILGGKTGTVGFIKNLCLLIYDGETVYIVTLLKARGNRFHQAKLLIDYLLNKGSLDSVDTIAYTVLKYPSCNPYLFTRFKPEILISKNGNARNNPASLTKLLTLLTALDYPLDLNKNLTVKAEDMAEDNLNDIREGDIISLDDALHLILLRSSNIMANMLSRYVSEHYL